MPHEHKDCCCVTSPMYRVSLFAPSLCPPAQTHVRNNLALSRDIRIWSLTSTSYYLVNDDTLGRLGYDFQSIFYTSLGFFPTWQKYPCRKGAISQNGKFNKCLTVLEKGLEEGSKSPCSSSRTFYCKVF